MRNPARTIFVLLLAVALWPAAPAMAQTRAAKTLDIYLIDVEGGSSILFVAPSGESLLIDSGYEGPGAVRDAGRILDAAHDAGLQQIDHLLTTHWHGDHYGGMVELAPKIPSASSSIMALPNIEANTSANIATEEFFQKVYPRLYAKAKHTVVKSRGTRSPSRALTCAWWRRPAK